MQFSALDTVLHGHVQRIAEYLAGFLKTHAVLASVGEASSHSNRMPSIR